MGVLVKIFVAFEKRFWTEDYRYFFVAGENSGRTGFAEWKVIKTPDGKLTNFLLAMTSGDRARQIERMDETKLIDEI